MAGFTKEQFLDFESRLQKSAKAGNIDACKMLGDLYYKGISGNDDNDEKAFPYWKKAADNGNATAAGLVGMRLFSGTYGEGRESEALPYLRLAADKGTNGAGPQIMLGLAYASGLGCRKDRSQAIKYYRMAALQNDPHAQYQLGTLLYLKKDIEYMHWICCAYINGNQEATYFLNDFIGSSNDPASAKKSVEWHIEQVRKNGIVPQEKSQDSGGGGCYIATAVYGSYDAPEVMTLRRFRDDVLLKHWWGKVFVKVYYIISPPLAGKLRNMSRINSLVRNRLDIFVEELRKRGM